MEWQNKGFWLVVAGMVVMAAAGAGLGQEGAAGKAEGEKGPAGRWEIPPEILQQILQNRQPAAEVKPVLGRLGGAARGMLVLMAGVALGAGVMAGRMWAGRKGGEPGEDGIFLLFGFFGSMAAVLIAGACVGSLYLHLGAMVCVMVSGYLICGFLCRQFRVTRRLICGAAGADSAGEGG